MIVDWQAGSVTLSPIFIHANLTAYKDYSVLFFQLECANEPDKPLGNQRRDDGSSIYSYSPLWAVADSDDAAENLKAQNSGLSSLSTAYKEPGSVPEVQPNAAGTSASSATTPSATSSSNPESTTTSSSSSHSASKNSSLSAGAIAGIVVGCVLFLVLASLGAACLCLRRRRQGKQRGGIDRERQHNHRGVRSVQGMIAEKESRTIIDTAPDTPYSERGSQHAMHVQHLHNSSLSLSRLGAESRSDRNGASRDIEPHLDHRGSASVGTAIATTADHRHGHDSDDIAELERESMMGPPAHRTSQQQQGSFAPYSDHSPTDYSQHHHVVDGADLVQQEQSNGKQPSNDDNGSLSRAAGQDASKVQHSATSLHGSDSSGTEVDMVENTSARPSTEMQRTGFSHARSNTPSGISGRYAHLVEEGMTEDEIQRLEEEERALDEAIEQASGGGRPSSRRIG